MYSFFNQVQKKYQVPSTKYGFVLGLKETSERSCLPTVGRSAVGGVLGSWYLVQSTKVSCFLFLGSCFTKKKAIYS